MAELNAGLLNQGNIGQTILAANAQKENQQKELMSNLAAAASAIKQNFEKSEIDAAMAKNFDPTTGVLNKEGVVKDLFASNPQKALAFQETFENQRLGKEKVAAEISYKDSQSRLNDSQAMDASRKAQETRQKTFLESSLKLANLAAALPPPGTPGAQEKKDLLIAQAESYGITGTEMFKGDYTPQMQKMITQMAVSVKDQADIDNNRRGTDIQEKNANTNSVNANTNMFQAKVQEKSVDNALMLGKEGHLVSIAGQENQMRIEDKKIAENREKAQNEAPDKFLDQNLKVSTQNRQRAELLNKEVKEVYGKTVAIDRSVKIMKPFNQKLIELRDSIPPNESGPLNSLLSKYKGGKYSTIQAKYDVALGGESNQLMAQAKASGTSQGGVATDKDQETMAQTVGLVNRDSFFNLPSNEAIKMIDSVIEGNNAWIAEAENQQKYHKEYLNKVKKDYAPVAPPSKKTSKANDEVVFKDGNVSITRSQQEQMRAIRAQQGR